MQNDESGPKRTHRGQKSGGSKTKVLRNDDAGERIIGQMRRAHDDYSGERDCPRKQYCALTIRLDRGNATEI
jgi:hypothetical protein